MTVSGIGGTTAPSVRSVIELRSQLDDLQRQLGTGKKSTSYAGLGLDRGLVVGLRTQLSAIAGYQQTITLAGVRLDFMQEALSQFSSISQQSKTTVLQSQFVLHGDTQTQDQKTTLSRLDQVLSLLNTQADNRYLFSGSDVDRPPVETTDHILDGDGLRAGLKQVTAERRLADLGADGLGRLVVGTLSATEISLAEDAVSPFGIKLVGANSQLTGSTVTGPAGVPPSLSVDLGATNPNAGETVRFAFTLPDGTSRDLTLTATASATPAAGEFTIGADSMVTATNLQAALTLALGKFGATELAAASAVAAGNDFFNIDAANPPQRVNGPPFETATSLIDGTNANTVSWYVGDALAGDPRATALARVDQSIAVSYGARANEEALRRTVQSFAVFATASFSGASPNEEDEYAALRQRIGAALAGTPNEQKISDIQGQLAGAQVALKAADDRHLHSKTTLENLLQDVEGAPIEEIAARLLALQTSLEATLQTTAMLLQTSLLRYL